MKAKPKTLDALLPLIRTDRRELHLHAAVLEVSDTSQLAELAAHAKIRRCLAGRLSDTAALVEPQCADQLAAALKSLRHTPKIIRGKSL